MKLNENESILTPRLLLVPYCAHHVQTYHEWMQDEELQKLTASEPLTLSEEYSMQESWRQDADKLTFIICTAPDATTGTSLNSISPGKEDKPECMIGDVNLFLYDDDDDDEEEEEENDTNGEPEILRVVGELEIMIARPDARGKGLAQEALEAFISYISTSLPAILNEYTHGKNKTACLSYLRVKIDKDNSRSLSLFKKLGFSDIRGPNYFGEMELRSKRVAGQKASQEGEGKGIAEKLPYGSSL